MTTPLTLKLGALTIEGTQGQLDLIMPTARQVPTVLGARVKPVTLRFVPLATMPDYVPGHKARGLYKARKRLIWLADSLDYPVERTAGHELTHWLIDDWFTPWHRDAVLPFLTPEADSWADHTINGVTDAYRNDVNEAVTVYLSGALYGYAKPAFTSIYGYSVPRASWGDLRSIALATAPGDDLATCQQRVLDLESDLAGAQTDAATWRARADALELAINTEAPLIGASAQRLTDAVGPQT